MPRGGARKVQAVKLGGVKDIARLNKVIKSDCTKMNGKSLKHLPT